VVLCRQMNNIPDLNERYRIRQLPTRVYPRLSTHRSRTWQRFVSCLTILSLLIFIIVYTLREAGVILGDQPFFAPQHSVLYSPDNIDTPPVQELNVNVQSQTGMCDEPIRGEAIVSYTGSMNLNLRDSPSGLIIGKIPSGGNIFLLNGRSIEKEGYAWVKVCTYEGEIGWVASEFLRILPISNDSK
jgi:hypothetical protein